MIVTAWHVVFILPLCMPDGFEILPNAHLIAAFPSSMTSTHAMAARQAKQVDKSYERPLTTTGLRHARLRATHNQTPIS